MCFEYRLHGWLSGNENMSLATKKLKIALEKPKIQHHFVWGVPLTQVAECVFAKGSNLPILTSMIG